MDLSDISLISEFTAAANFVQKKVMNWLTGEFIKGAAGLAVGYAATKYALYKAGSAIEKGRLAGHLAPLGETFYIPSGVSNSENQEEFIDQKMRTYRRVDTRGIFPPQVSQKVMRYIDKASKLCTEQNPVVFSHLCKVIPPKEFEKTYEVISREWKNYFSELLNRGGAVYLKSSNFEESVKIPVLVQELGAERMQYRILLISPLMLGNNSLPDIENTRIEVGRECVYDPSHHYYTRLTTNKSIASVINGSVDSWFKDFGVFYVTGQSKTDQPTPQVSPQ